MVSLNNFSVTVDASDLEKALVDLEGEITEFGQIVLDETAQIIAPELSNIINQTYQKAVNFTGGAFFEIYTEHLREGLLALEPFVEVNGTEIIVVYDDIETLGSAEELAEAMHYQALLKPDSYKDFDVLNPAKVELPYTGEELYNPSERRQEYWEAMLTGSPFVTNIPTHGGKFDPTVDTAGELQETLQARVDFWGTRYPEWILLDEGVEFGEPTFPPTHFVSRIYYALEAFVADTMEKTAERLTREFNNRIIEDTRIKNSSKVARGAGGRFVSKKG